jgi:hypothetical protein
MEADWEVEIGGAAPVIDACWEGVVDLRLSPEQASHLPETRELPALAEALLELNSASSPVWTAKCDVWRPAKVDLDELDAQPGEEKCAIACYIDLLPRTDRQWQTPEHAVAACRTICAFLHGAPLRSCRADIIVRRAYLALHRPDQGITAYLTACGGTPDGARATLETALRVFAVSVHHAGRTSTLQ